ncbi:protoheme IX farnesyltransferase, mitochondrial [Coffea arabica]|uniref:Heme O synthase n=1 Tax=Coffea arabica TaxID=13443 RepID=A0A6P6VUK3_COFAR|nr:protoheme IX farnesyltransferase, mitochondrial-like isoform X1 [Coffea arabica]
MWRNSLIFSSKLVSTANPRNYNYAVGSSLFHSQFYSAAASTTSFASDSLKSDPSRALGSSFLNTTSLSAFSASKLKDAVNYYGRCYFELSKARLSLLVVATSGTGYILGSGSAIDFTGLCCTCAGTMMVAASANTLNQVYEINNDALMKRTRNRPLPSGRLTIPHAVTWASCAGIAGTALLAWKANVLAAGLAASNLVLYAFVYTPLKQMHPINTWVGAIVGAIPPLLGWAAAAGEVSLTAMILPAALYFWQIPHFMALAYLCRKDYADGGFKMFSLADASGHRTAMVALRNCLYLLPLGYLAYDWGITSGWFCLEATILALAISGTAMSFCIDRTTKSARRMFRASLLYLPVFMSGLLFHRLPDNKQYQTAQNLLRSLGLSSSSALPLDETEQVNEQHKVQSRNTGARGPPVAYASVAPFPFLPAPTYVTH